METSLRYGGDSSSLRYAGDSTSPRYARDSTDLRIHAKEKFPIDSKTLFQVHGELNTKTGAPSYFCALIRHFYPDLSASLGVGLQYDRREKLRYSVRGKKAFPVTANGLLNFNIKGRCDVDKEFRERKLRGAAEFAWSIFNFRKDQDVRLKVGYEVFDKVSFFEDTILSLKQRFHRDFYSQVPYLQVRENNWTLNADINGKWNVRYDL